MTALNVQHLEGVQDIVRSATGIDIRERVPDRIIWYAVYVRQRRAHPENIIAEQHRKLSENVQLAISLGATVVTRESEDVAGAICEFAAEEHINLLVVGKPTRPGFFSRAVPSIVHELLDRGRGFDLVIIDTAEDE